MVVQVTPLSEERWTTKPLWLIELLFHWSRTWALPFCRLAWAVRLDGAAGMVVTVTLAWAFWPLAETFTWKFPVPLVGAVYSPVPLIVPPPPLTCQVKFGWE